MSSVGYDVKKSRDPVIIEESFVSFRRRRQILVITRSSLFYEQILHYDDDRQNLVVYSTIPSGRSFVVRLFFISIVLSFIHNIGIREETRSSRKFVSFSISSRYVCNVMSVNVTIRHLNVVNKFGKLFCIFINGTCFHNAYPNTKL